MTQVIYGDILFIINFSMDFLTLFVTGKILHNKMRTTMLVISSALGAVYAIISLFAQGNAVIFFIINICVSVLMCYIAYSNQNAKGFIKSTILFYAISFLLGGGITALYSMINSHWGLNKVNLNGDMNINYSEIPFGIFIILAGICGILSFICGKVFHKQSKIISATIIAEFEKKTVEFEGLSDSGNLLTDPISGKPVIITTYENLKAIIPIEIQDIFLTKDITRFYDLDLKFLRHIRMIPMTGIGYDGILIGFIPDKVTIIYGNKSCEKEAIIAVDNETESNYKGYESIMPAILID